MARVYLAVCKQAFARWIDHNAARLGAALAFYTLLSLAPLLIFVVALVAAFFGRHEAQTWILEEARALVGPQGASAVLNLLKNAHRPASGLLAESVGALTLLFGASGVFSELRDGLDTVWEFHPQGEVGWKSIAQGRLFAFGMVLAIGFLLLVSLVFSTVLATAVRFFSQIIPVVAAPVVFGLNFIISIYSVALLFTLIFKYVPHVHTSWSVAWRGSLFTAILFTVGKMLLGVYLGMASISSAYGAAGSVVAVVVWVYYSAQIFYFGAEFTWVNGTRKKTQDLKSAPQSSRTANAGGI